VKKYLLVGLVALATGLGALAATARADGDPASDILYFQDVYLPFPKPSDDTPAKLQATVNAANKAGFRIKVAVIATPQDLGSIPSLFGKPQVYAQFLGVELGSFYKARLLVVMPSGFGVYRGGKAVTAETRALAGLETGQSASEITAAASTAVGRLRRAVGGTRGGDSVPPTVRALAATGKRGSVAKLRFVVADKSGKARAEVRVYGANYILYATLKRPLGRVSAKTVLSVPWKVPASIASSDPLRFCVVAADAAGNLSAARCARLRVS
jgi:hypothetical protein